MNPHFDGVEYSSGHDFRRLTGQLKDIMDVMGGGDWYTLSQIEMLTGHPSASISAQLRNLRKPRFGGYTVERRARGDRAYGLFEYRVLRYEPKVTK
jgi:hypothetical protein